MLRTYSSKNAEKDTGVPPTEVKRAWEDAETDHKGERIRHIGLVGARSTTQAAVRELQRVFHVT